MDSQPLPPPDRRALYGISVTSELTGVAPQNLRAYEAKGLIEPARTDGGTRRYSDHDIARIERISTLLEDGLNTKGIGYVLALEAESRRLRQEIERLRREVDGAGAAAGDAAVDGAGDGRRTGGRPVRRSKGRR